MHTRKRLAVCVLLSVLTFAGGIAYASDAEKVNDIVLRDRPANGPAQYLEFYKKEGNGDKNYLYTLTQVATPGGNYCTVVTGDSEKTIAISCSPAADVAHPEMFLPADPARFRDGKFG